MIRWLLFLWWPCFAWAAPVSFDLSGQSLSAVVQLVYQEAMKDRPYSLHPDILEDRRPVSFRYAAKNGDFRPFWRRFVTGLGYTLDESGGVDFITKTPTGDDKRSGLNDPDNEVFFYAPRFRDAVYLADMLTPLFQGKFSVSRIAQQQAAIQQQQAISQAAAQANRAPGMQQSVMTPQAPQGAQQNLADRPADQLLFIGSGREVAALRRLLDQVDQSVGQVLVTGVLYEVSTRHQEGSALQLAGSLLGSKLELSLGGSVRSENYLSFKVGDLSAIARALDSDDRFKVLSSPQVRVSSGNTASFVVGEDVPVLGQLVYQQGSNVPIQSVEYRSSGVIFNISPKVRDAAIDLRIDQQVSAFTPTNTGVNNSPTLSKRSLSTSVSLADGDVVVIGGLRQDKQTGGRSGLPFLPAWFQTRTADQTAAEMLLFLQVRRL